MHHLLSLPCWRVIPPFSASICIVLTQIWCHDWQFAFVCPPACLTSAGRSPGRDSELLKKKGQRAELSVNQTDAKIKRWLLGWQDLPRLSGRCWTPAGRRTAEAFLSCLSLSLSQLLFFCLWGCLFPPLGLSLPLLFLPCRLLGLKLREKNVWTRR